MRCLVIAACLALASPAFADALPPSISVSGQATVSAAPDLAEIEAGVTTEAKTARAASEANAKAMNDIPKIIFSKKGFDPTQVTSAKGWADARVLTGDLAEEIKALKQQPGKDLMAHGGIEFAQNLVQTGLVDEFFLAVHPVAAGRGAGLFEKLSKPLYLKLIDTKVFSTGAMVQVYQPDELSK